MPYKDPEKAREAKRKWEREKPWPRKASPRVDVHLLREYANDGWRDEADELGLPFCVSPA